jgi:hypothetical protein
MDPRLELLLKLAIIGWYEHCYYISQLYKHHITQPPGFTPVVTA